MLPPIPHGRTARRLEWAHLPPTVRAGIEEHCGSPVVEAVSQGGGFTPGFASVLTCQDGSHHFVKAASAAAQRIFAESYREEARKLRALPESVPAPRLLWVDEGDWVVLGLEYVEARAPRRPWRSDELDRCLDAAEQVADQLTPVPEDLELDGVEAEFADWPALWETVRDRDARPHAEEAAALAATYAEVARGETLVHTDLRDDNVLLTPDGRALFCDWNWPVVGAPWLDSLILLISPRGDGVDVERILAERRLLRDVPADHVDRMLALLAGYLLSHADEPVPPTSPHLRAAQRLQGEATWGWLCERRGWR
jgi:aminoglycoside phosphotransferase (APT) family kinase protein